MKNDELFKPSDSALVLERDVLPASAEDTAATTTLRAVTSNRSPKGAVGLDDHPLPESDMGDEPVEAQEKKKLLPLETLPLPALRLRYITLKGRESDLRGQVNTHTVNRNAIKAPQGSVGSQASSKVNLWQRVKITDTWLVATFILACIAGGLSILYFYEMHQTLLYGDANAPLLIARRVTDNLIQVLA